ncbi:hypothetical protein B2A_10863 [mine drainage metagenome]|uniref:Uncharacterized protein n=1 Tax=mine drainage metagenome TaxID=410659 RepID=T1AG67_9ZZZZ
MKSNPGIVPSAEGQRMLESLRRAVVKVLERKRRLGQYAVIWQHGKPAMVNGEAARVAEDAATYAGRG